MFTKSINKLDKRKRMRYSSENFAGMNMVEEKKRSILKALSWRATGTIDTIIISFIVTSNPLAAVSIGAFELITKTALYYFHERTWNKIEYGRKKIEPEYQI